MLLFGKTSQHIFAMKKDKFISVSIDIAPSKSVKRKSSSQSKSVTQAAPTVSEDVDVNDLFSDVWTKKIVKPKPKAQHNRRLDTLTKKIQTTQQNDVIPVSEKLSEIQENQKDAQAKSPSTATEVNEYLAKIQAIVYEHFHVPANTQGSSVKAVIELNALGKMLDFRILNYSSNDALNKEADRIKERLRGVIFPLNPNHTTSRTIVILKSKE